DPQGRELHLDYLDRKLAKAGDRFRGVQSIDSPVGRFTYEYGSATPKGTALPKADLLANLVKVSLPTHYEANTKAFAYANRGITSSSVSRLYHFEDPHHPTLLTGITVSGIGSDGQLVNQRISTYQYDQEGRGILSVKGLPLQRSKNGQAVPGTGIEQVNLQFIDTPKSKPANSPAQTRLTNSLGQITTYTYTVINEQARLLKVSGAGCATCNQANVQYTYDKLGRMTEATQLTPTGQPIQTVRTELDGQGRPLQISTLDYQNGKAQPPHWQVRYEYAGEGAQPTLIARPSVIAGQAHQTRIAYNAVGQPTQVTESGFSPALNGQAATPISRTTTYTYGTINGRSLLTQIDGPLKNGPRNDPGDSDVTRMEWDRSGSHITALTQPGKSRNTLAYDTAGRIKWVQNAQGASTTLAYNTQGQLTRIASSAPGPAQAGIKPMVQSYRYDALGNRVETGSGGSADKASDDTGSADESYRPQTLQAFDTAGHLLWQAEALGILKRASYDTEGNLLSSTVQTRSYKQTERYRYDAQNHLIQVADSTGVVRNVVYGDVRPRAVSAFKTLRDDFGREVMVTSASHGTLIKRYNAADQLVEQRDDKGNLQRYAYDPAGQRTRYTVIPKTGAPQITTWRYAAGRLIETIDPIQIERIAYNDRGLPASKTVSLKLANGAEAVYITRYTYNADGSLQSQSLPDGSRIEYERNGRGQVVAVNRQTSAWTLFGWGRQTLVKDLERDLIGLKRMTYGNGIQGQWQRSREGVLARVVYTRPGEAPVQRANAAPGKLPGALGIPSNLLALFDARLLYDDAGDVLLQKQQGRGPQQTQAYAYDGRHQLIAAQTASPASAAPARTPTVWRYHYDDHGNRVLAQEQVPVTEMGQTRKVAYDPASNAMTTPSSRGREYVWDAQGQLIAIRQQNKDLTHYRYNYLGLRVSKQVGTYSTYTLYNDQRQRIADLDANGKITRQYIWLADQLIATLDAAEPKALHAPADGFFAELTQTAQALWNSLTGHADRLAYVHVNHLGAPIAATNAVGQTIWQADYAPYGKLIKTAASGGAAYTLALRLPGQWEDAESGLYYNDARYYNPNTGRYLSPDPLGRLAEALGSPNAYSYVNNNPLSYIDPWGLILFAFDGTGNSDPVLYPGDSLSNVVNFRDLYASDNKRHRYITGVGTVDRSDPARPINAPVLDAGVAWSGPAR
ncbi:MAG: RHS repeat-associated core domain-containing protein, partial [Sulfuriferula sp.]